ncbi:MAG TPA: TIGR01777 family oxidoreductase [Gemmatimonadaceae bacterium]
MAAVEFSMAISGIPARRLDAPAGSVVITGGHGMIGASLVRSLSAADRSVRTIVRRPARDATEIEWRPDSGYIDAPKLTGADMVVHLAGENIAQRWTPARRRRIRSSRSDATRLLAAALAALPTPPRVLVSASAVGIYGDRGDEVLDESSAIGTGFLARIGAEWEAATEPARAAGVRVVHMRLGVVLSPSGGILARMLTPFRLGIGGRLGSGRQWVSWIALSDVLGAICHALGDDTLTGPVNVCTPNPVTNAELTRILAGVLGRPAVFPVPALALRAVFGDMANETILASQRVRPSKLMERGFEFEWPTLERALRGLLS